MDKIPEDNSIWEMAINSAWEKGYKIGQIDIERKYMEELEAKDREIANLKKQLELAKELMKDHKCDEHPF